MLEKSGLSQRELRQSLGLIALSNFIGRGHASSDQTKLEQARQALKAGSAAVTAIDQDGTQFQVLRVGEAAGSPEQFEALDSDGRWRIATDLVTVD